MRTILPLSLGAVLLLLGALFVLAPSGSATSTAPLVDGSTSVNSTTDTTGNLPTGGCC
ncbi:hypothetical protein ACFW1A_15000 [Kitasatospora sp. NPDC058965]|uniref:hypothetical protein n=1 Tax=Kitasatospora sp. NPDC058965 TaxID=3346682 RepID=UPI0036A02E2A